jgi:putative FmdB family regulatory protein
MPIYEYKCNSCGKKFEKIEKFSDAPLETHEECGGGPVERLISAPAFQFKGTGWYVTDYANKSNGGGAAGHNGSDSHKKDSSSEAKSDSSSSSDSKSSDNANSSSSSTTTTSPSTSEKK